MRAPYDVTISQVDDGSFIVRVGCMTLTFIDAPTLLANLKNYYADPKETIAQYEKAFGWPQPCYPEPIEGGAYSGSNADPAVDRIPAGAYQQATAVGRPVGGR